MQIELPDEAIEKARQLARDGEDAAAVFVTALERLERDRQEVAAIQEGIDAYQAGHHRPVDAFFDELMAEEGLTPPR